jgi:hypothetical protein
MSVSRARGEEKANTERPEAVVSTGRETPRSKSSTARPLSRSLESSTNISGYRSLVRLIGHCIRSAAACIAARTGSSRSTAASKPWLNVLALSVKA